MRTALCAALATFIFAAITLSIPLARSAAHSAPAGLQAEGAARKSDVTPPKSATPVIVELFTSEGCSDCPPADRLLYALEEAQPVPGAEIIALEEHVDYWDSDGWRDPFSSSQFTQRQKDYVDTFNLPTAYTPQMVVDGTVAFVGSDRNRALAAIGKAALAPKANLKIEEVADAKSDARDLHLRVNLAPLGAANPKHGADVLLAVTEDKLESNVTRGENAGKYLRHLSVVRELRDLGRVDSAGSFSAAPDLNLDGNWKRENLHVVVFVQDRSKKGILGASELSVSKASE